MQKSSLKLLMCREYAIYGVIYQVCFYDEKDGYVYAELTMVDKMHFKFRLFSLGHDNRYYLGTLERCCEELILILQEKGYTVAANVVTAFNLGSELRN